MTREGDFDMEKAKLFFINTIIFPLWKWNHLRKIKLTQKNIKRTSKV